MRIAARLAALWGDGKGAGRALLRSQPLIAGLFSVWAKLDMKQRAVNQTGGNGEWRRDILLSSTLRK
jgi:hypothetical protein